MEAVFILGLFSKVFCHVGLLHCRDAPVPAEVPLYPLFGHFLYAAFRNQYRIVFHLGVSPYLIAWPILYYRDFNGSLTNTYVCLFFIYGYVSYIVCIYNKILPQTPLISRDYATPHVCLQQIKVPFWNVPPFAQSKVGQHNLKVH